jgi:predicted DNA-binding transcriptional regulator AlpA
VLPNNLPPRGLSRVEAAAYIGISPSLFDRGIKDRLWPKPFRVYGRVLWCRRKLDAALDLLAGADDTADDPWSQMAL